MDPRKKLAVDVRSDASGEHTTIAVRMPGMASAGMQEAMRRKVEYELHKIQVEMSRAMMDNMNDYPSDLMAMQNAYNAQAQVNSRLYHQQQLMQQTTLANQYGLGALGQISQGPINQAASAAVAGVQSAQPKPPKKRARKNLLLCEVKICRSK